MRPTAAARFVGLALSAGTFALAGSANGALIDASNIGTSFTVSWELKDGVADPNGNENQTGQDITAQATFTLDVFDIDNDFVRFTITALNTTDDNDKEIGLIAFGFGTNPDATSVSFIDDADGEFITASLTSLPQFPDSAQIDVTSETGVGAPNRLLEGESDTFDLQIGFADLLQDTEITISPFNAAFQSDPDSFQIRGTDDSQANGEDVIPEPATLALIGAGLVAGGVVARRRGRKAA